MANDLAGRVDRFHPAGNVPQPVCEDRLTVSRQRLTRLRDIAGSTAVAAGERDMTHAEAYARGVRDVLIYLIDRAQLDPNLAALLDIEE